MLKVDCLRDDMEKLISIINRDRYTYLIFKYEQYELDKIEDSVKELINRLIGIIPVEIDDNLFSEITEMCDLEEIIDIVNSIDRNGELVEIYNYNW